MTTHILLTGATGMLGSEILYTLLADKLTRGKAISISVLVRPNRHTTARQRMLDLLAHPHTPYFLSPFSSQELLKHITVYEGDCLYVPQELIQANASQRFTLIHAAGTKDFGQSEKTKQFVWQHDYQATLGLTKALGKDLSKLIYVSSAFSSGIQEITITDDFLSLPEHVLTFRNHHERCKYQTERAIVALADQFGFAYTIARPSMMCGRLLFSPQYHASNYSGLYQLGAFCWKMKHKQIPLRIYLAGNPSLNIVPVDYTALAICRLVDSSITQVNVVSPHQTKVKALIEDMIQYAGLQVYSLTSRSFIPNNSIEHQFAKTVGSQLSAYLDPWTASYFDPSTVQCLMGCFNAPQVEKHFVEMYQYAQDLAFGKAHTSSPNRPYPLAA